MKTLFTIKDNREAARQTWRIELDCGFRPGMHAGQFVDVALDGFFLRRPISVCDITDSGLVLYYKVVGAGTAAMSSMKAGDTLELLTDLGNGFDTAACRESALLVGGGLGAAPMHLLCRELLAAGRKVSVVLGFNSADEVVLLDSFRAMGV